jgi:1,4-alpha-glucan branching enzyme
MKKEMKKLFDEAERQDPEMGLGFDPILDAQDNPEEFEIETADAKTGYVIVRGKDWKDFRVAMVLKQEDGKWLVDGCGAVNVPKGKRIAR